LRKTLKRASELTLADWSAILVATGDLAAARIAHATHPIAVIIGRLRKEDCVARLASTPDDEARLKRLAWAISVAAARVPWRSDCLLQAMAADRWLRRHAFKSDFFLGVTRKDDGALDAHAWLACGPIQITGGRVDGYVGLMEPSPPPG